jgi:hypothetical protein
VVEASSHSNQPDRVYVTLDVDFRTPLIGGLPACSELCRRRKAMHSTLASASRGSASSKARNSSGLLARTSHDGAISGFVRGQPGASLPLDQVE